MNLRESKRKSRLRSGSTQFEASERMRANSSYGKWIAELKQRYRATQIKAAVAVNSALIEFYWGLGKDISERFAVEAAYGSRFFERVSRDMREAFPDDSGFSPRNIRYCRDFFVLYKTGSILPQVVAKSGRGSSQLNVPQVVADLILVPWGHHRNIIDKCKGNPEKVLPTSAQLAKCYADAEAQLARAKPSVARTGMNMVKKGARHA